MLQQINTTTQDDAMRIALVAPPDDVLSITNPLKGMSHAQPITSFSPSTSKDHPSIQTRYSYKWWDSIYDITGPSYQIKYPHPDRDYYEIALWESRTLTGAEAFHNQIDSVMSGNIIPGGWAALFASIAAFVAAPADPLAQAVAALVSGLLGALFGYATQATLSDEDGCIWWWWGRNFDQWFWTNLWWLILTTPSGFVAIVGLMLLSEGYFRVGDYTFCDGAGIGNP